MSIFGSVLKAVGGVAGGLLGGPAGAAIGSTLASTAGSLAGLDAQKRYTGQANELLSPYVESGNRANNQLMRLLGMGDFDEQAYLTQNPDVAAAIKAGQFKTGREHYDAFGKSEGRTPGYSIGAELNNLPGYQFTRDQGLKSVQNSAAARGLGISGAAFKGASGYATGLADSTYGNQFNRLLELTKIGQNSAAGTGANLTGLGNAAAGAYGNIASAASNAAYYPSAYNLAMGGSGGLYGGSNQLTNAAGNTNGGFVNSSQLPTGDWFWNS